METYISKLSFNENIKKISFGYFDVSEGTISVIHEGGYKNKIENYLNNCKDGAIETKSFYILPPNTPNVPVGVRIGNYIFCSCSEKGIQDNLVYSGVLGLLFSFHQRVETLKPNDHFELKGYATGLFREKNFYLMARSIEVMNCLLN